MSGLTAFLIVAVLLISSLAGTCWYIRRATVRGEMNRDRIAFENTVHDVGPDSLRLLRDLDLHLNLYVVDHPDVAEGFARLHRAIEDQPKGDQQ